MDTNMVVDDGNLAIYDEDQAMDEGDLTSQISSTVLEGTIHATLTPLTDSDMEDAVDVVITDESQVSWRCVPDDPSTPAPHYPSLDEFVTLQSCDHIDTPNSHRPNTNGHDSAVPSSEQTPTTPTTSSDVSVSNSPSTASDTPSHIPLRTVPIFSKYQEVGVLPEPDDAGLTGIPIPRHDDENSRGELLTRQLEEWEQEGKVETATCCVLEGNFKTTCDASNVDLSLLTLSQCWENYPHLLYKLQRIFDTAVEEVGLGCAVVILLSGETLKPPTHQHGHIITSPSEETAKVGHIIR